MTEHCGTEKQASTQTNKQTNKQTKKQTKTEKGGGRFGPPLDPPLPLVREAESACSCAGVMTYSYFINNYRSFNVIDE